MHEPKFFKELPENKKKTIPFFPNFFLRDALLWLIVLNVLLFLTVFFPWEIGLKADPFASAPEGIRPEWYFMFMFQSLKILPAHILFMEGELLGILFFMVVGIIWMLVPFWAKEDTRLGSPRSIFAIGIVAIIFILFMTVFGYVF